MVLRMVAHGRDGFFCGKLDIFRWKTQYFNYNIQVKYNNKNIIHMLFVNILIEMRTKAILNFCMVFNFTGVAEHNLLKSTQNQPKKLSPFFSIKYFSIFCKLYYYQMLLVAVKKWCKWGTTWGYNMGVLHHPHPLTPFGGYTQEKGVSGVW